MQPASLPQHTASPSCDPGAPFCLGPSGRAARSSTDLSSLPVQCTWSGVAGDIRLLLLTKETQKQKTVQLPVVQDKQNCSVEMCPKKKKKLLPVGVNFLTPKWIRRKCLCFNLVLKGLTNDSMSFYVNMCLVIMLNNRVNPLGNMKYVGPRKNSLDPSLYARFHR